MMNLDLHCAKQGNALANRMYGACLPHEGKEREDPERQKKAAKAAENLITRMLGVLQGHGIYALFLLLAARKEKGSTELGEALIASIKEALSVDLASYSAILDTLTQENGLLGNIPQMLLAKRVMEQTLIYARYHAKAKAGDTPE